MLAELETRAIEKVAAKYRRRAIAYLLCGIFVLAALYHASVAALLALEPEFGAMSARLCMAGFFALAALSAGLALRYGLQHRLATMEMAAEKQEATKVSLAMIVEAVLLGYSWSRGAPFAKRGDTAH